jgi:hypothetical protein
MIGTGPGYEGGKGRREERKVGYARRGKQQKGGVVQAFTYVIIHCKL